MVRRIVPPVILAVLTILFIWPLLKIGYANNLGSLEPATLVMARRVAQDGIWGWYANWYLGFPFRFAGPPASWWFLGAIEKLGIFDLLAVYRFLKAVSLMAFPISFYFLARRVFGGVSTGPVKGSSQPTSSADKHSVIDSGNSSIKSIFDRVLRALAGTPSAFATRKELPATSFVSVLFLVLFPSIGYLFPKFWLVGTSFGFAPAWMQQELSRSMGLALLPLVLIFYWRLLEKINYTRLVVTILATALLFLTDGVTSLALLVGITAIVIIETHKGQTARKVTAVGLALALAFLLDAFFFTPQNIRLIASSPSISGIGLVSFIKVMVQAVLGLGPAILVIASFKLFNKERLAMAFVLLWTLPFVVITLLFYASNRNFLTEYTRFLPEIEIGMALAIGYWVSRMVGKWGILNTKYLIQFIILGVLIVTILYSLYSLPWRWQIFRTNPDITKTIEYQIARWLERETGNWSRVFLSGSTAFWLNEFAPETWQVRGGIDQASTHPYWAKATYQIRYSPDGQESLLWLKALRVGYLVVHDGRSSEYYHDFIYPEKFEKVCAGQSSALLIQPDTSCRLVFDNGLGDRIYRVDTTIASSAPQEGLKRLSLLVPGKNEMATLTNYVSWFEFGKSLKFSGVGDDNKLTVKGEIGHDEVVSLGVTYDRGWQARDQDGNELKTSSDPLGNLVVFPKSEGEQEFHLSFNEGFDLWFGIAVSLATLIFIVFLLPKKLALILEKAQKGWEEED
ncbi:hypothetical protein A2696_00310 [Candidatus Curtissbacteria bacterium RIFCSPHIGHO2_01_FULL_41_13]|uniref:Membrane protein 6-pyruvoyl-tetrahydropterin synthase-related domain-containing protein n=1 Tax=Candidatus Curtissbacteria bacterium RIFCSPHIGHO2_01_FULL_41_13 TaxID=1797745 RepID=A0A1F5G2G1_9BACT|nr:MAG: hypothetical protein A2696_00310 [Candidatus Curtissbacteria bacterium RIFCSPHIGHO2_01_FULL_41_13]